MGKKNISAALALIGFGIFYGYQNTRIPTRTLPNSPDPSFFPWILTVLLLILSCALLIQGFKVSQKKVLSDTQASLVKPATCLGIFALYLAALPWFGFLIASIPFFGGMVIIFGERRKTWWIPFSVGVPLFLFLLFQYLFQIPLPRAGLFE